MGPRMIKARATGVGPHELLEREIADRERERLGRELHDGLCQSLAGIAALASTLSKSLARNGESGPAAAADEIALLLKEAISEARDLTHSLCPIGLSDVSLRTALEILARNVSRAHGLSCSFDWDGPRLELARETKAHLVRIAQEAVHNAITHARSDKIDISLEYVGGLGRLSIRDNGVGLSDEYRSRVGIGLHAMHYRARAIGGSLSLARCPRGGTVVACTFHLPVAHELRGGPEHARCPG